MTRLRVILGLAAGAFLVLSSGAHSLLGWTQLHAQLVAANVPPDLIAGLALGWHFAGGAMLALGLIVLAISIPRLRGGAIAPSIVLAIIAALYLAFGAIALIGVGIDPFIVVVFILPGLLLAAAAPGNTVRI